MTIVTFACAQQTPEEEFTEIYRRGVWGTEGFSGGGAQLANARQYVHFLQSFLKEKNIRSVIDIGCGDWGLSQHIDWTGIQYTGYDVVRYIIEKDQQLFGTPTIMFVHADALETDLPEADLLICKDVLQHISNANIIHFLAKLNKFKHCLITNDFNFTPNKNNLDVDHGGFRAIDPSQPPWRELDLTAPPFNSQGHKILTFQSQINIKQVLHIENARSN